MHVPGIGGAWVILANLDGRTEGKTLGHNIYDDSGRILLRSGVTLTESYIQRLRQKGYLSVYVQDELAPDLQLEESIDSETRVRGIALVKQLGKSLALGRPVDVGKINGVVDMIVDDLKERPDGIVTLSSMKTVDDYTFEHSVNVCVLSAFLWWNIKGNGCDLFDLARGALLHDIGKLSIPLEILLKPGPLTDEEYAEVKRHAQTGYNVVREILPGSSASPLVAREHHERLDGSGYPGGIRGEELSPYGRIAAVADVYDAVTSDRVYRKKMFPHKAMQLIDRMAGTELDPSVVGILMDRVTHYPTGSRLLLGGGEIGIVSAQDERSSRRPQVRLLTDPEWNILGIRERREIALVDHEEIVIEDVLEEYPPEIKARWDGVPR